MLQDEAKHAYQREYMRKRRAGEPTTMPQPQWGPTTQRMVDNVAYWFRLKLTGSWKLRGIGCELVAGLEPHNADGTVNEAAWNEALQRYRTLRAERHDRREREKTERDAPPVPKCWFCGQPQTAKRILVGPTVGPFICRRCTTRAASIFAKHRSQHKAGPKRRPRR